MKRSLILLFLIVCITVNVAGLILYTRYQDVRNSADWVTHTNQVISEIEGFYGNVEKMIAMQRGYLLTNDPEFMAGYDEAAKALDERVRNIATLTRDNSIQQRRIPPLVKDIDFLKSRLIIRPTATVNTGGESGRKLLAETKHIKSIADNIRNQTQLLIQEEEKLLRTRRAREKREEQYYTTTLFGASAVSIIVLLIANMLILGLSAKQKEAEYSLGLAERDLGQTRERLELAMRGTSDGIFDWDIKANQMYYSQRFRDMLGYSHEEFADKDEALQELIHPDDRDAARVRRAQYLNRETADYRSEYRILHKDGFWRWHLVRAVALFDAKGQAYRMVGAHTDITEDKAVEERLRASNKELENFTYIASHDLRSPLVNLKGFAGEIEEAMGVVTAYVDRAVPTVPPENPRLLQDALHGDIPQALNFIKASVTKMEKLTKAILELSRAGRRQLRLEPVNIKTLVENCVKTLQHQITQKGVEVVIGDLPNVTADNVAMEQVFGNVIDNAIKYLDPARPGLVEISGQRNISETVFSIKDNGRGIRQEDLVKVFELFKRAGRHDDIPGEGMGMSYVQTILRRHGGTIWLDSQLGIGTSFYISLPNQLKREQ